VTPSLLQEYLGAPRFDFDEVLDRAAHPGVATGLAYTAAGGDVLFIEVTAMSGRGSLTITGQLGDVMRESALAALTWVRSNSEALGIPNGYFRRHDFHLHVPAGAVPKDGPSAGITMAVALASVATGRRARSRVGMTGEITLTGRVLPIGGVKEKVLAARRAGIREIILPERNRRDLEEDVPEEARKELQFHFVSTIDEALPVALEPAGSEQHAEPTPVAARQAWWAAAQPEKT
jgi:ATP-dependent Lon protease